MLILIVDDADDSCDLTEAVLLSAGYTGRSIAHSAREAFKVMDIASGSERAGRSDDAGQLFSSACRNGSPARGCIACGA